MKYKKIYAQLLKSGTYREVSDYLAGFWPEGHGKPWSESAWWQWYNRGKDLCWEAEYALCKASGLTLPDPPITVVIGSRLELPGSIAHGTGDPKEAIVYGDRVAGITLRVSPTGVGSSERRVHTRVVQNYKPGKKRRSKRKSVSVTPDVWEKANSRRKELDITWDEYLELIADAI